MGRGVQEMQSRSSKNSPVTRGQKTCPVDSLCGDLSRAVLAAWLRLGSRSQKRDAGTDFEKEAAHLIRSWGAKWRMEAFSRKETHSRGRAGVVAHIFLKQEAR